MGVWIAHWTKNGPLVKDREIVRLDGSGLSTRIVEDVVVGDKRLKPTSAKGADHAVFKHDSGLLVALKAGHAYTVRSGDAVLETDVLTKHTLVPAPGPDPEVTAVVVAA
jgi:hypothetical protein